MHLLKQYLSEYKTSTILALIIKFVGTLGDLVIPLILAKMIDDIAPQKDISLACYWGSLMLVAALITVILNVKANHMSSRISRDVGHNVRRDLYEKTMYLSATQIDKITVSSLETRMTSDIYNIQQVVATMLRMGVRAPIIFLGGVIVSFTLDVVLTCVMIAMMPIIAIIIVIISKRGLGLYEQMQTNEDKMVSRVRENVSGIRVIKALSSKQYETDKFEETNIILKNSDIKATANMVLSSPSITMFLNIGTVLVIYVGAYRVINGYCEIGVILAFITYFTVILNALIAISRIFIMSTKGVASANRVQEVLELEEDLIVVDEATEMQMIKYLTKMPHICFENVSFAYDRVFENENEMNLQRINFKLNKGETLGIIGATGSGKSTLLMLLMRFYDASIGNIYIDGKNIKTIPLETLHGMFGVVLQSDYLFNDTILENISFGRELSKDEVEESAKIAQASKFVSSYDNTYSHKLAIKGSNLSGGQKQRLLIARAVADSPEILILDDSSSALDYKTDSALRHELKKARANTTTVLVAQRVSAIMNAQLILVLDEGKIIAQGTHEELLEICDSYKTLSEHQLGAIHE